MKTISKNRQIVSDIVETVSNHFNLPNDFFLVRSRKPQYCYPRQWLIFFINKHSGLRPTSVSRFVNLHRKSIYHSVKLINIQLTAKHPNQMKTDYQILNQLINSKIGHYEKSTTTSTCEPV